MSNYEAVATRSVSTRSTGKVWNSTLWVLQILAAFNFLMAGSFKLMGAEQMVHMFATIGLGQWLRYFTGGVEVIGAILLLIPSAAGVGALTLAAVMVGAVFAEIFVLAGQAALPATLFVLTAIIAYGRREGILRLRERRRL